MDRSAVGLVSVVVAGVMLSGCLDPEARPYEEFLAEYEARGLFDVVDVGQEGDTGIEPEPEPEPEPLCSPTGSSESITVIFESLTGSNLDVLWVDWDCELRPYGQIGPWGERSQQTFVGHVWQFRLAGTSLVLSEHVIEAGMERVEVGGGQ